MCGGNNHGFSHLYDFSFAVLNHLLPLFFKQAFAITEIRRVGEVIRWGYSLVLV